MTAIFAANTAILRVIKRAVGNPDYEWANTYEVVVGDPLTTAQWNSLLLDLMESEQAFHTGNVQFVRATASSWVADSRPYDPYAFLVREFTGAVGGRITTGQQLPRNVALHAKRSVSTGRSGKLFYRGCLTEDDVEGGTALTWQLNSGSSAALQSDITALYSALSGALVSAGGSDSHISMLSDDPLAGIIDRPVLALQVRGVNVVSADHRFFDRAP